MLTKMVNLYCNESLLFCFEKRSLTLRFTISFRFYIYYGRPLYRFSNSEDQYISRMLFLIFYFSRHQIFRPRLTDIFETLPHGVAWWQ